MKPIVALSFLFITLSAFADDSIEAFGRQMMTFYKSASPEAFQRFQQNADRFEKAMSENKNWENVLLAVAIAKIAEKHGWPIEARGTAGQRAKEILVRGSELAKYIEDDKQIDPTKLDIWWMSFFSTGDILYLEKILQYAGEPNPTNDFPKMLVIATATWSFKSNCGQDEVVRAFAKQKLSSTTTPEKKAFLQECIEDKQN